MVSWRPSASVLLASLPGVFALFGLLPAAVLFEVVFIVGTGTLLLGQVDVPRVLQPLPGSDEAERCPW